MPYLEADITMTGKDIGSKGSYQIFGHERKTFRSMAELKKFLKDRYGNSKRSPMYIDTKDGKAQKTGYIYGFINADYSHAPVHKWYQQDWVEITELTPRNPFKK